MNTGQRTSCEELETHTSTDNLLLRTPDTELETRASTENLFLGAQVKRT